MLVAGVSAPLLAKLADIYGKKRLLLCGAGSFVAGSVLCASAPTFPVLLLGRGMQGVAVVGIIVSIGLIRDLLDPRYVPVAIGALGVGTGTGSVLGPLLGAWLIENFGFRSCFWFLAAYMFVAAVVVAVFVPETTVRIGHRLDVSGAVLLGGGAGGLIVAASWPPVRSPAAVLGVVLIVAFVLVERRKAEPLISLELLARPAMWTTLLVAMFVGGINGATSVLFPQLLRARIIDGGVVAGTGMDAGDFALYYGLPQGIAGCCCGLVAGWMSRRFAPRTALIVAVTALTAAVSVVAVGPMDSRVLVVPVAVLMGMGVGMYFASSANLVVEAVPATSQSISQSMKNTVEAICGAVASAAAGASVAAHLVVTDTATRAVALGADGFRTAFLACALAGGLAVVVAVAMPTGRTPATGGVAR